MATLNSSELHAQLAGVWLAAIFACGIWITLVIVACVVARAVLPWWSRSGLSIPVTQVENLKLRTQQ